MNYQHLNQTERYQIYSREGRKDPKPDSKTDGSKLHFVGAFTDLYIADIRNNH